MVLATVRLADSPREIEGGTDCVTEDSELFFLCTHRLRMAPVSVVKYNKKPEMEVIFLPNTGREEGDLYQVGRLEPLEVGQDRL